MSTARQERTIFGPRYLDRIQMDVSAHAVPNHMKSELLLIFPGVDLSEVKAIITMQHAKYDLVNIGPDVDKEKDDLLEKFFCFAKQLHAKLAALDCWSDYIDPCSGLAMLTPDAAKVYGEVSGAELMLGYATQNAGCCKILLHPKWGSAVYPATMFTTAPESILEELISGLSQRLEAVAVDPSTIGGVVGTLAAGDL